MRILSLKDFMQGFYSLWVEPSLYAKGKTEYEMQDYDLLTMILSVLKWQQNNGPARMIADKPAREYLQKLGLENLFDDGFDELSVPKKISPNVYWAAGKLCALQKMPGPCTMIDLDLIIWQNLEPFFDSCDVGVIHKEELRSEVYPSPSFFSLSESYAFHENWNFEALPCNTAMLYVKDPSFKDYYVEEALKFMMATKETKDTLCHMVFAEQRMLSLCAEEKRQNLQAIFPLVQDIGKQQLFTHTWGHKNILRYNYEERRKFCIRVLRRIQQEFPTYYEKISQIPALREYGMEME